MSDQDIIPHNYSIHSPIRKDSISLTRAAVNLRENSYYYARMINKRIPSHVIFNETILAPLIDHPNITNISEIVETDNHVFQFIPMPEHGDMLSFFRKSEFPAHLAIKTIYQILSAVDLLHSYRICHRDIKPENIFMYKHAIVKLSGFASASISFDGKVSGKVGSIEYAAPEVVNHHVYNGFMADMWSVGITMYVIFARRHPFTTANNQSIDYSQKVDYSGIPHEVVPIIMALLNVDPSKRPTAAQCKSHKLFSSFNDTNQKLKQSMSSIGHDNTKEEETLTLISKLSQALDIPYSELRPKIESGDINSEKLLFFLFRKRINKEKVQTQQEPQNQSGFVAMPKTFKNALIQKVYTYHSPTSKVYSTLHKILLNKKVSMSTPLSESPVIVVRSNGEDKIISFQMTDSQDGTTSNLALWCDIEAAGIASQLFQQLRESL
ncbi:CAMK family protein kinase [Tritrichomonas foetus]|uniref:CAMK family protein kinase n=1 Tax=Tritrichomonas foetus TaxID=1144522 RepID=A0A1J4K456_9EUKA|nr:CAMK family protein kinase [Tritrichomonas foetus]|eukprot:OHT06233.1 CAMK family protein kinase [Tritrichomonas foetus]